MLIEKDIRQLGAAYHGTRNKSPFDSQLHIADVYGVFIGGLYI